MAEQTWESESALVCAAQAGDRTAMEHLLQRHWAWLRCLVYGIVRDHTDDVLQEVAVRVIRKIGTVRQPQYFRPWLGALAKRVALRYRSSRGLGMVSLDDDRAPMCEDLRLPPAWQGMEQAEQCQLVIRAIHRLPEKYREVFMMQHSGDLTYKQIAEILGVPLTTVQIRLVRARRMILDTVSTMNQRSIRNESRRTTT